MDDLAPYRLPPATKSYWGASMPAMKASAWAWVAVAPSVPVFEELNLGGGGNPNFNHAIGWLVLFLGIILCDVFLGLLDEPNKGPRRMLVIIAAWAACVAVASQGFIMLVTGLWWIGS